MLDMIGGDYIARNLRCLATNARHVSIAIMYGSKAEIPIWTIMQKRLTLTGSTLRSRSNQFKEILAREIERDIWPEFSSGRIRPTIDEIFSLEDVSASHVRIEEDHVGTILLKISS